MNTLSMFLSNRSAFTSMGGGAWKHSKASETPRQDSTIRFTDCQGCEDLNLLAKNHTCVMPHPPHVNGDC